MSKNKSSKKLPLCECGCEATTKGGRFIPGHDAKLKKALIDAALGGSKRAAAKLDALGWTKFFDAKVAKRLSKPSSSPKGEAAPVSRRRGRPHKVEEAELPSTATTETCEQPESE